MTFVRVYMNNANLNVNTSFLYKFTNDMNLRNYYTNDEILFTSVSQIHIK